MIIPLIVYILFLISYILFIAAIFWHFKEYIPPQDKYRWITNIFLGAIAAFLIISALLFFLTPWDEIIYF
ncbi:MAG: hypothetical protein AAB807_00810 [Patescibacteria group bacterium]